MCAVNDEKRKRYDDKINNLKEEYIDEENKLNDLKKATEELHQLVDAAQCTIDNISDCNFGGNKILSSITISQKGYMGREDYYADYMKKCKKAMSDIKDEIRKNTKLRNALSVDCGVCDECKKKRQQ